MTAEFTGQVVLVSGAASGIGYAQARKFLEQGAYVFGIDLQEQVALLLEEFPQNYDYLIVDVSQEASCQNAVRSCLQRFGQVDILLNTAGILDDYQTIEQTTTSLWQKVLAINVDSLFYLTQAVLPNMLSQKKGTVINMASIASLVAGGGGIAYTTAKHAIAGFTKQLALDYADQGIHVNAIAPGAIQTPMNAADFAGEGAMAKWVAEETPVKRWAQPEEVAELTLFLASSKASFMQGNIVPLDGGWLLK
ncbi:MAG: 3-oxoacyl-ACP reductase [Enterococcus sp.]